MRCKFNISNPVNSMLIIVLIMVVLISNGFSQEKDINTLIQKLNDKGPYISKRIDAASALGEINDPRVIEPLIAVLKDKDDDSLVRGAATSALGKINDPRVIEPLIAALKDDDKYVREAAASALGKRKASRAVEPLIAALKDADKYVREAAASALGKIGKPAVESLNALLKNEYILYRGLVASILGDIKDSRSVEPLIALLDERNAADSDRWAAASALVKIKDQRVVGRLIAALKDKDFPVIAGAYEYFIARGESGTEDILIEALNRYGSTEMAQGFLNCGNSQLYKAARSWANARNIPIVQDFDRGGVRWGR